MSERLDQLSPFVSPLLASPLVGEGAAYEAMLALARCLPPPLTAAAVPFAAALRLVEMSAATGARVQAATVRGQLAVAGPRSDQAADRVMLIKLAFRSCLGTWCRSCMTSPCFLVPKFSPGRLCKRDTESRSRDAPFCAASSSSARRLRISHPRRLALGPDIPRTGPGTACRARADGCHRRWRATGGSGVSQAVAALGHHAVAVCLIVQGLAIDHTTIIVLSARFGVQRCLQWFSHIQRIVGAGIPVLFSGAPRGAFVSAAQPAARRGARCRRAALCAGCGRAAPRVAGAPVPCAWHQPEQQVQPIDIRACPS